MKRTKSRKQCMAEALLMGEDWYYNEEFHVHLSLKSLGRIICAETLYDVPYREYMERRLLYSKDCR